MEEAGSLFVALALLILLAVTSLRYGVDSRDGFRGRRGELAKRGIDRDVPSGAPNAAKVAQHDTRRLVSAPADCGRTPCTA